MSVRAALISLAAIPVGLAAATSAPTSTRLSPTAITLTQPDPSEIVALRAKAERGNAIAQYNLGLAYAQGRGTAADAVEAFVWLTLAAEGGSTGKALETVLNGLNGDQFSEGRERLQRLREAHPALRASAIQAARTIKAGVAATATPAPAPDAEPPSLEGVPASAADQKILQDQLTQLAEQTRALTFELGTARDEAAKLRAELARRASTMSAPAPRNDPALAALQSQLADAQASLAAQSTELATKRAEAAAARVELANAQAAANHARARLDEFARQNAELAARTEQATLELTRAREQATAAIGSAGARASAEAERNELTSRLAAAEAEVRSAADARRQVATLTDELAAVRQQLDTASARASQFTSEKQQADAAVASRSRELEAAQASLARNESLLAARNDEVARLRGELAAAASVSSRQVAAADSANKLENEKRQLQADLAKAKKESAQLATAQKAAREELDRLRTALAESERKLAAASSALEQSQALMRQTNKTSGDLAARALASSDALAKAEELAARLSVENKSLSAQLADAGTAASEVGALREKAATAAELETRVRQLEAENATLAASAAEKAAGRDEADKATRAKTDAEGKLAMSLRSYAMVAKERDELKARVASLSTRVATLTASLAQAKEEAGNAVATAAAAPSAAELDAARRSLTETQEQLSRVTQESETLRQQAQNRTELESRIRELEEERSALTSRVRESARLAEERLAANERALARITGERDALDARVADLGARLAAASPTAEELDTLRSRASIAEHKAELARAELARTNQLLAAARAESAPSAEPVRPAPEIAAGTTAEPTLQSSSAASAQAPRLHVVVAGETLSGIARQYYGSASRWPEILAANRDVLRDERSLVAGRTLRIP